MKEIGKYFAIYFLKSVLAGILISIACMIYITNQNIIGALLFSVGLLCITSMNMKLYTGMVGHYKFDYLMILSLLGNILGTYLMSLYTIFFRPDQINIYMDLVSKKLSYGLLGTLIMSIVCGLLIFIGVRDHIVHKRLTVLIMCIAAFVIIGADHCIANSFYFFCSNDFNWNILAYLLVCIVGNTLGSYIGKLSVNEDK